MWQVAPLSARAVLTEATHSRMYMFSFLVIQLCGLQETETSGPQKLVGGKPYQTSKVGGKRTSVPSGHSGGIAKLFAPRLCRDIFA